MKSFFLYVLFLFVRTSLAEVTSDLEELQHRWQQIETCCRLDIGVCTSFLCNESTDSPVIQTRYSGKMASSLGVSSSISHESLPFHRVYTYPSFQSSDDNPPPPYHVLGRHTIERQSSDPSANASERETANGYDGSEDDVKQRNNTFDIADAPDVSGSSTFNEQSVDSENSHSQQDVTNVHTGEETTNKVTKLKNSVSKNGDNDDKSKRHSFSNAEDKSTGTKKKWWSRGKKHNSEGGNHETNSLYSSKSKGSMPILSQKIN